MSRVIKHLQYLPP